MKLKNVLLNFRLEGDIKSIMPFGSGHIHQSYRVANTSADSPDYFLQQINGQIFPDVSALTSNIVSVTKYLNDRFEEAGRYKSLQPVAAVDGKYYYKSKSGRYWRVFIFEKKLRSFDEAENTRQIHEAARAFGAFLAALADFPATHLHIPLPRFHELSWRLQQLDNAVKSDAAKRLGMVKSELQFIRSIADKLLQIEKAATKGQLPLRVTHNDSKLNNVLFDSSGNACCVIDLDTVMPGLVHYDFGDGLRTTISAAAEDETDLQKIQIEVKRFEAFASGYLEATRGLLSEAELDSLHNAPALLALIMGVRFLTDFLSGDIYYQIAHSEHNIQRARAQLELCRKLRGQGAVFAQIIQRYS